jgi:ABC-type bacteriocin/lantibiotic exporter with double-glycine peptidase domain
MNKIIRIVNYFQKDKIYFLICLITFSSFVELLLLYLLQPIIYYFSGELNSINFYNLKFIFGEKLDFKILLLFFLFVFIFKCLLSILVSYQKGKLVKKLNDRLSTRIYSNYISKNFDFFINNNSSNLIANIIFEVQKFSYNIVDSLLIIITELFLIITVLIYLLTVYFKESILLIVVALFFFALFFKYFKSNFERLGKLKIIHDNNKLEDLQRSFYIIQNIKLDYLENFFYKRFRTNSEMSSKSTFHLQFTGELAKPVLELLIMLVVSLIIIIFYIYFNLPKSEIFLMISIFVIGMFRVLPSCNKVFHNLNSLRFHYLTTDIIYSEIFLNNSLNVIENYKKSNFSSLTFNRSIELKDVNFSYSQSGLNVLSNVNIEIKKNQMTGICGPSGSGKTTLLNLICYLLKPSSGKILLDNKSIENEYKLYQEKIGYVSQRVYLIDDSIINNVILGQEQSSFDYNLFAEVIKKSDLEETIKNFPLGKDTVIGERGSKLSGGQQQRLGIARALYKKPEILILDEATSALDNESEEQIFKTINSLKNKITIIIVTHKKSLIEFCDKKYKVHKGIVTDDF